MNNGSPFDYPILAYIAVVAVAIWGGLISAAKEWKPSRSRVETLKRVGIITMTSSFAGVLTFWAMEAAEVPRLIAAIFIAISGHAGVEIITWLRTALRRRLENL